MMKMHIIQGLPGSGKSTLARELSIRDLAVVLSTDDLCYEEGVYRFRPELAGPRHLQNQERCLYFTRRGVNVVIDNTNITNAAVKPYVVMALEAGYEVVFHRTTGVFTNTHAVPEATIEYMRERMEPLSVDQALTV